MENPFFKNNGPFELRDILKDLNLENNLNNEYQNIVDIKWDKIRLIPLQHLRFERIQVKVFLPLCREETQTVKI